MSYSSFPNKQSFKKDKRLKDWKGWKTIRRESKGAILAGIKTYIHNEPGHQCNSGGLI